MKLPNRSIAPFGVFIILVLIGICSTNRNPSTDPNDPTGKSSLAFVFDITGSMFDDLVQVREGAAKIFKTVMAQREKLIYNYIMVPFHDPHLGDIINTTDSTYFMRQLGKVYVHGGGDCPEKTLTGILKALEISLPSSFIYVFTDARSKDYHLEDQVLNTIQEKQSSVVFVMTGDCGNRTHPGFRTYEKIAAASFGQVFHLEKSDVSKVLEYVRHAVKQKKVHLMYEARERGGTTVRTIPVDKHLSELTISLSGDKDDSDVLDITLRDSNGNPVDKQSYSKEGGTIDLKNVKLIRIKDPAPGPWQVITNSRLKHTIRVFGHGAIDFKYGFAARPLDRIELARPRPVLNQNTYLLVNMTGLIPPGTVGEISLIDYHGNILYTRQASPHRTNPHMYFVGPFVPPKGLFFVQVSGVDEGDFEFKRIAPTAIGSVVVGGPRAFMAPFHQAFVGTDVNLTCTVESASPFTLYWTRGNGERVGGPLFYQTTDTAVWTLPELSLKDGGEYKCEVISDNGNYTVATRVEPRESPPQIIGARNVSAPIGSPAFLHCPTQSAGPVEIRWIRHGATVFTGPNTERNLNNGTLKIHSVSRSDAGVYECQARNAGGMTSQIIRLDIMEPPQAKVQPERVYFVTRDSINISCYGIGEPKPELHWYYNGRRLISDSKYYIGQESKSLYIRDASPYDEGKYECRAMSPAGMHTDSSEFILAITPKVELSQSKTMIGRGDSISFECKVLQGKPTPKIRWLRNGKELLIQSDKYININGGHLHISGAQDSDAGSYSCVAENMAGRDIGVVDLTIGRMPSIVPSAQTVRVNIERQLTLQCLAIGHPAPEIEWQKGGVSLNVIGNDRYTQLADGNLLITDAQVEDQDRFTCIARNIYGQQSQTTAVIVTGLVSPVLGHVPPEEQLIEGQDLHLSCVVVLGTPRPNIVWLKDGQPVETSPSLIIEGGGTSLLLRGGDPKDEGRYTCVAVSPAGNATININVQLIKKPEFVNVSDPSEKPKVPGIDDSHIATVNTTHDVLDGDGFAIPCNVFGQPPPTITWYLDGRPIVANRKDFVILPDNTLLVKRADKTFSGTYVCQAANSAGESSQTTTVRIMSKPSISAGQSSFNMVVNEAVNIPCDVFGDPKPKIVWYLDNVPFTDGIVNEDGSLTIPNLNENHRGTLMCKAENAAGFDSRNVTLTVHTTPHIEVENQEKSVILNETIVLECPAQAHPPPVRIWTYEGEKIDTLLIPHTIREDGALVLSKMQVEHTGVFTCHVSNLAGEDSLVYTVNVLEKPKIISETPGTIDVVKGLMIEIPCRATGIPEVSRAWQKDGINLVVDSNKITVDSLGTLRISNATKNDAGNYNCVVTNQVGSAVATTSVVVQEPPVILPSTTVNYTAVIGDKLELRCYVDAYPPATIQWLRRGILIADGTAGITLEKDGSLTIEETTLEDATIFTCKASNPAGKTEANLQVTIIAAPDIPDQDTVIQESVRESQPFSLYCPVFSTPLPTITWYVNDKPLTEDLSLLNLSEDRRKLHVYHAKVTDSGVYKCVARNAAGEGSKSFQVEVIVPLNLDESEFKKKVFAKEGEEVTLGCPVSGYPTPTINWVIDGRLMQSGEEYKGAKLSADGRTLHFTEVGIKQEGVYHCVAQSKSGTLDVDVELSVLAIPRLGEDEKMEIVIGKPVMLSCDVLTETDEKTTFVWSMNGSETSLPKNVQIPMNGQRLYITDSTPENSGEYRCRVSNSAGKSEKLITLEVLEPPEFVDQHYNENEQLIPGKLLLLSCLAKGNPKPVVEWRIDGENAPESSILDGEKLRIEKLSSRSSQITCVVSNSAGVISRDFFVQNITPPKIIKGSAGDPTFREGDTITLDCPVSQGDFEITWMKQGAPINDKEVILTLDKTRLTILNARRDHEDIYTCVANNTAGQVAQDFGVAVHVPPKIAGSAFLQIETNEGAEISLHCDGEGNPKPEVLWDFNRKALRPNAQLVNENQTVVLKNIQLEDGGVYKCYHINVVGQAVKTINVVVKTKPSFASDGDLIEQEVNITRSTTLECDVSDAVEVDITWTAHGVPLLADSERVQILSGGRYLHIPSARVEDDGSYSCTVTNSAGTATKNFRLHVQVPPTIINDGGEHQVIENNSLVLPCEVDGSPRPVITWTKDGKPLGDLRSVQILSEGQQFKIVHAETRHRGSYVCRAQNDVGTAEINFDVDIITRPSIAKGIKDIVEVVQGDTASFKCPIGDKNFKGQIIWLYNFQPINMGENPQLTTSHGDKRLNLQNATIENEGPYSCRIRNDAGETKFDFKLQVLVPPKIVMLDKDKNRVVVENSMITLSCPATGKPEPDIKWYKDGEELSEENIQGIVPSGELNGNELKIMRVKDKDSGKYSCEAINVAGSTDQEVNLNVQTVPRIEKEGIPPEYEDLRGGRVTISCPVFAKPQAVVTWLKAGKPLQSDHNVKTSSNGQKLYFLKLQNSDSDKYTCVAKNPAGEDKRDFTVNILVAPSFDEPNVVRTTSTNAGKSSVLNCPANGSPPPTITWLKDGITLEENERFVMFDGGRQLQISNTQGDDQGRYTCIATNSVGSDDLENTLEVIVPPVIEGPSHDNISVIDGFAAELKCDSQSTGMEVEWHKNGQRITPETLRGDSYLQIPSSGKRLSFLSARKEDAGKYTCIMRNAAGESRRVIDFFVNVPPIIHDGMSSEIVQTVNPATTVDINCVVEGTPHPKVIWLFNDKPIKDDEKGVEYPNDGETIRILNTNDDNVGKYKCIASNAAGTVEKDFLIRITAPPKFLRENEFVELKVGDSMMLTCNVESATPVHITWDNLYNADQETVVNGRVFNITNVKLRDEGTYVCNAENEAGRVSKNFDLKVIEVPEFYDHQKDFPIVIGKQVTLDCSALGTPEPTIYWMKDGRWLNSSFEEMLIGKTHLVIENPQEDTAGRYTCIAENKAGRVEKDMMVAILKPPQLPQETILTEVLRNEVLTLQCPVQESNVDIKWSKLGTPIQTNERVQVSVSQDKLYIMNADESDSAQYSCTVSNQAGEASVMFDTTVNVPPFIFGETYQSTSAIANKTVTLNCEFYGTPAPEVSWLLDGKPIFATETIQMNNGQLVLNNITPDQEGRYTCRVQNKVGKYEQDTYVEVSVPPEAYMPTDEMKVVSGRPATIRCEVIGDPEPKIEWLKNGEPFKSELLQFSSKMSYLHLREADVRDSGRYTCIATNQAGEDRISVLVHVLIPPTISDDERILQVKEETPYTIICPASGSPTPSIVWKKDGAEIEGQTETILDLGVVDSKSDGRYTCIATNEAGSTTADFMLDVMIRPKFSKSENEIKVVEGERAKLECKVDGHPKPTIKWLKGGRPLNMTNVILSPRGETLMILKARRADGGSYSCVAKNTAGESEAGFNVNILTVPYIEDQIDQNPKVVAGTDLRMKCLVRGNPKPKIEWIRGNKALTIGEKYQLEDEHDLVIKNAQPEDEGTYTCSATNEAGTLDTNFVAEVIGKPTFTRQGDNIYEVIEDNSIIIDCGVTTRPVPDINWFRGENPIYLTENFELSHDNMQLTVKKAKLSDGGKYICRASNEAGITDIDLILKVLVPPKIDKSNIIGNPLAIINRNIYLECPVFGIPQPSVMWTKDGKPIDLSDSRVVFAHNNETFGIEGVTTSDQARYTCTATNPGGKVAHDFNLDVLSPPTFDVNSTKPTIKREGDTITLTCPIKVPDDVADQVMDVTWVKDSRPLDEENNNDNIEISSDKRRLTISAAVLSNAGQYSCIALNRAGETSLEFKVDILSPPIIDTSKNEVMPQVALNQPTLMYCPVSGHPFPNIKWLKDGVPVKTDENIQIVDKGQIIQIVKTDLKHAGKWSCVAENDAGVKEHEMILDVFTPPVIHVHSENPIKALGETITIWCNATGNPSPTLTWTKDGQKLQDSPDGVRISLRGSRLDIPHLKKTDVGDYTCQGQNEAGTSDSSISVDVLVPPEITRDGIDMSPRLPAGQTLNLQCLAQGKPEPTISWMLNDTLITERTNGITIGSDSRFIQINNISLSDKGVYTCLAENVAGKDKLMYNVDVVQAPVISNGGTKQVIEGDVAKMECLVEGYPAPQVSWLRNGIRVETGVQGVRYFAEDKNLTVIEARSSDSGIYVCAATNEAGTAQQAYTLEVLITPKIVKTAPLTLSQASGSKFTLPCTVRGYPEPDITWSLNGKELVDGQDGYSISSEGDLTVENAEGRNLKFECNAKNAAGDDTLEYTVQTINAPKISSSGDRYVNGSEGEQTSISCDIEGDAYDITWSRNGLALLPTSNINFSEDKKTLNIASTRLSDQGEYSCTATNKAGNATQKTKLNVGVPPKILERPKTEVVNRGEQVTLWCEASGVPQPTIEWYKDDELITKTAVAETTTTKKKAAIFSSITPQQSGVYTCKAKNWVGETEEDVDLIVMIAPEVVPERMNVSTNPRQTVFLSCNATGIPEPVITWIKVPNTTIQANEKYQLLGTTLAIRNVLPDDDGFYHCIAKSEAGQKIASRKLTVNKISDKPAPIWVECDENNKPKKTEYMVDRGDSPDDNPQLLPWKDVEDESIDNTITYRCMPGPRSARMVLLHAAPQFIVTPKNHTAAIGANIDLKCSAAGPPAPLISWAKNGRMITRDKSELTYSVLKISLTNSSDAGNYTCFAQNSVGISTSTAHITLDEMIKKPENEKKKKNVAVVTCYDRNVAYSRGITWEFRGVPLQRNLAGIHFMNNGSLVILDTSSLKPGDLKLYTCKVRNRRRHTVSHLKSAFEELPVVKTPEKIVSNSGDSVVIDCEVKGDALTTNVIWTKNDQKVLDDDVVYVLPNNSLVLLSVEKFDEGIYKCVASNGIGKSYDDVKLVVNEDDLPSLAGNEGSGVDPPLLTNSFSPTETSGDQDGGEDEGEDSEELETTATTTTTTSTTTTTTVPPTTKPPSTVPPTTTTTTTSTTTTTTTTTTEKPSTTSAPVEGSAQPDGQDVEPTTIDSIVEKPITDGQFVETPDCYDGVIDENGECIEQNGQHHKLKILSGNDNCPDGFSWNTRTGICEDIDECVFDQPCEFECSNTEGSYECRCPPGYDLTEDGCFDINECEENRCDPGKACFNQLGGYECINDPCPSNFTLVDDRYCEPNCDNCGDMPITVHMLAIPSGLPVSHIATLTAYDKTGRVLNDTTYVISETYQGLNLGKTRAGPFTIKAVKGGHAQVWTNRVLRAGTHHKVRVRAHSEQGANELHTPKETNFLVLINVGQFPF